MTTNTRTEALAEARAFAEKSGAFAAGMCLREIRTLYNIPAHDFTPGDNRSPDASEAWKFASHKHPETDFAKIPPGVPVFWTGGSAGHGHIAMKAGPAGSHDVWSTDFVRVGHLDRVDGRKIGRDKWVGLKLVGWTEDLNGVRIYQPGATPEPAPKPTPAPHPSMALPVDLVDLSHFNDVTPAKVAAAVKGGVKGFYHKATEGTTWRDSKYDERRKIIAAAKVPFGAYHFARPSSSSGAVQARHFLSVAKPKRGSDFRVMLDLEDRGGKTRAQLTTWVGDFVREVVKQTGVKKHLIYTPFDLDDHFGWDLWVARYHPSNLAPRVPAPWKSWKVRQFSNGVIGVPSKAPGLGAVDLNNVVGSVADLKMPAAPAPKPTPTPVPTPTGKTLTVVTWNVERDRNPGTVRAEVDALLASTSADVLCLQEANDYAKVLANVPGYTTVAFHDAREQDGNPILVRNGLERTKGGPEKMTSAGWVTVKGGTTPPIWATVVTVEGIQFWSLHTPPSQQPTAKRKIMPRRAKAYDELMSKLRKRDCAVWAADWNVTPDADSVPSFPRRRFKELGLTLVAPKSGTHGSRVIDYFGVNGVVTSPATVVPGNRGSDHKPVLFTVTKENA